MADDGDVSPDRTSRRDRILEAMVVMIAEYGYEGASVGGVCARAKVSRRTFYELFSSFEGCFLAILDRGMETMAGVMLRALADEGGGDWLDRMLATEAAVLTFLDSEPEFARVLLVDALGAGSWALERRQDNVGALRDLILEQFKDTPLGGDFPPMAAAGVMASLLGIMHEHLLHRNPAPLISLLGPLMGVITTPYLPPEAVAREIRRGEELARKLQARRDSRPDPPSSDEDRASERDAVEAQASSGAPLTARARECLSFIAAQNELGFSPSNREIAAGIGIRHESQISRLLADLVTSELIAKHSDGAGKRNAWQLTPRAKQPSTTEAISSRHEP